MAVDLLLLFIGIVGLWLGTELVVRNAIAIAHSFRVSELFIGLTILAFGTDLPEIVVAIDGALYNLKGIDTSGIVTGNAIGSCISQISLVMGATAMFHFLSIGKIQIRYFAVELIGSLLLLVFVSIDNVITWDNGAFLIIAFLIYFLTHLLQERRTLKKSEQPKVKINYSKIAWNSGLLMVGLAVVAFSSDFTVNNALKLANFYGLEQSFIGAVLIGAGTSLPELAISVNAVLKKKPGLSVGNIIGSNIFDLLIPLGLASLIADIKVESNILIYDVSFLAFISIIVLIFLSSKRGLQKWEGAGLVFLYVIYAFVKFNI